MEHWLARWFRNSKVAGSNPAEDDQGYELFGEIALKNRRFFLNSQDGLVACWEMLKHFPIAR